VRLSVQLPQRFYMLFGLLAAAIIKSAPIITLLRLCRSTKAPANGPKQACGKNPISVAAVNMIAELVFATKYSSIQRSNTYDCAKRGTYKMRWLHADHASSKCDYQSSSNKR